MRIRAAIRSTSGLAADLRPQDAQWLTEHEFLKAFPGTTHEQYLDTPTVAINWLLRVDRMHREYEAEKQAQANAQR